GETIDERAGDLALDLGRVDRVTGIGGGDDTVDLEPAIRATRHLSAGRDIAAIAHELGEPVIGAGWGLAVAHRVAHLILNGRDPQRLLLLTFTRRAGEVQGSIRPWCALPDAAEPQLSQRDRWDPPRLGQPD